MKDRTLIWVRYSDGTIAQVERWLVPGPCGTGNDRWFVPMYATKEKAEVGWLTKTS